MKRLIPLVFLLVACGVPQMSAPTAQPATAAPIVPIEFVLLQSGDLPSGVSGGQVKELIPILFKDVAPPSRVITQSIERNGVPLGNVTVFVYSTPKERDMAYSQMLSAVAVTSTTGGSVQPGIGEQSFGGLFTNNLPGFAEIVFSRCHAVVHIRLNTTDATDVTSYAKRLDTRLQSAVC
jgi:hypothetical protein